MKNALCEKPQAAATQFSDIVNRSPIDLQPWPGNPRVHPIKQITLLKAAIQRFGFTAPILTDEESMILSGHGRVQAAMALGLSMIPTRVIVGLTKAEKRAYVLADNKLSELSKWDQNLVKAEIEILLKDDFEIEATGFSTAEVDVMFDLEGIPTTLDSAELQAEDIVKEAISRVGDLWCLGNHFLLCGNALTVDCYKKLLGKDLAQLVITDPPYNVPIGGHVCGNGKIQHAEFAMAAGEMSPKEFTAFLNAMFVNLNEFSQEGAIVFSFMDWRHMREIQDAANPIFGPLRQLCIWVKDNGGLGSFYRSQHELVFVFKKGEVPHINNFELGQHGRYRTNVWHYPGINSFKRKDFQLLALHPTVKPVSLIADAIRDCSHHKGIVLDPFAGSGTVLIAAERTGRYARAIELDPQYVDVAVMRWQRVTGVRALLGATGQSWDEVRAIRTKSPEICHGL